MYGPGYVGVYSIFILYVLYFFIYVSLSIVME